MSRWNRWILNRFYFFGWRCADNFGRSANKESPGDRHISPHFSLSSSLTAPREEHPCITTLVWTFPQIKHDSALVVTQQSISLSFPLRKYPCKLLMEWKPLSSILSPQEKDICLSYDVCLWSPIKCFSRAVVMTKEEFLFFKRVASYYAK